MSFNFPTIQKIVLSDRQIDYNPKDDITIMLDGNDISLLNGKNSFLRFSVKLNGVFPAELDRCGGGGHSILERISIYSGDGGTLLEQLDDYPVYIGTRNYFDKTTGTENMRNLLEGLPSIEDGVPVLASPYYTTNLGNMEWTWVEVCLPLYMSGVLYGDQAFPVIATNGLMIKIHLADADKAIRISGNADDKRPGFVNNRWLGASTAAATPNIAAAGADLPCLLGGLGGNLGIATGHNAIAGAAGLVPAGQPNVSIDAPNCFQLAGDIAAAATTLTIATAAAVPAGLVPAIPATFDNAIIKPNVNAPTDTSLFPWTNNMNMYYVADAGNIVDCGVITGIAFGAGVYTITFNPPAPIGAGDIATAANNLPVWVNITPAQARNGQLTYSVRDIQLVCSVVEPPPQYFQAIMKSMKTTSGYEMDIKSFNLYRNNLYENRVRNQELIPTTEFRARALLHAQLNPSLSLLTSFYKPLSDYLRQYQYTIRNRLVPQLPVPTNKEILPGYKTWNAIADAERIKMLHASKVDVKDELNPAAHFVFGREVAKAGHSSDLNTHEVRITQDWGVSVNTQQGIVAPQQQKLLYTYVRHFRKIAMRPGNVVVSY